MSAPRRPNMTGLPEYITRDGGTLRVFIRRRGVSYRASVPARFPGDQLAEAIRLRDHFLRIAGPAQPGVKKPRSNTGVLGISETTQWRRGRGYGCFQAEAGRAKTRKFIYGTRYTRAEAFELAKHWRSQRGKPLTINPATLALLGL